MLIIKKKTQRSTMAILPIITLPDPRLYQVSEPVTAITEEIRIFMKDLAETMFAEDGAGLAAVQVGVLKQILVMDKHYVCDENEGNKEAEHAPFFMINPVIIERSKELASRREWCFSVPGEGVEVERPSEVTVRYMDENGQTQEIHAKSKFARCVQHEMDHLHGVTTLQHVSPLKRNLAMSRIRKRTKKAA
jgi:peptide deformylase